MVALLHHSDAVGKIFTFSLFAFIIWNFLVIHYLLQRSVYIASDGGRVCRPLVIADKGVSRIKEQHMKELRVLILPGSYF